MEKLHHFTKAQTPDAQAPAEVPRRADAPTAKVRAISAATLKSYAKDWAHFARWCRACGADPLPPSAQLIGRYIAYLGALQGMAPALSARSIARRLAGLVWGFAQRGQPMHRKDPHIINALADVRRQNPRPSRPTQPLLPGDMHAILNTLPHNLRGMRDRAIVLLAFATGLRKSDILSLDCGPDETPDSRALVQVLDTGASISLRGKGGWRRLAIDRTASEATCPLHALAQWLHFARIKTGPIFVAVSRDGLRATDRRLGEKHVARLMNRRNPRVTQTAT